MIKAAKRKDPLKGRYATLSSVHPYALVINIAAKRTTKRAKGRKAPVPTPSITIAIRETKEPIINTSPCAKLIIPIMP